MKKKRICDSCNSNEATIHQNIYGDYFKKQIFLCENCFNSFLKDKSNGVSSDKLRHLVMRSEMIEEKKMNKFLLKKLDLNSMFIPQIFYSYIYNTNINEKYIEDSIIKNKLGYFEIKLEKAISDNDYELSEKIKSVIEKLKRHFKNDF